MNREIKFIASGWLVVIISLFLAAYGSRPQSVEARGTTLETDPFSSNGELIYFTYPSDPIPGGLMMGDGQLTCAACHAPVECVGAHNMDGMDTITANTIPWPVLHDVGAD